MFINKSIGYYSLGCKVNLYECESIINEFEDNGFIKKDFDDICDVYLINTCSVTLTGDSKSRKIIREAIKRNDKALIIVMGCYAQLIPEDILNIFNEYNVNAIVTGTTNRDVLCKKALEFINGDLSGVINLHNEVLEEKDYEDLKVERYNDKTRGFVKIQDGCDNYCAYCTIPYARGHNRSRDSKSIIDEITVLTNSGMKEIVLTGINTGAYGLDKGSSLTKLLSEIVRIPNLGRIRISSIEQTEVTKELLEFIYNNKEHFCMHFHMPLQGGCDNTLKRMNRKYDIKGYMDKINLIRSYFPDINITTDCLTGFAGETREDFEDSLKFIDSVGFGEMHVFPYSRRPRTIAYNFPNQVNDLEKKMRVKELLELNNKKALEYRNKFLGKKVEVVVEKYNEKTGECYGHSSNYMEIKFKGKYNSNDLVSVLITKVGYPTSYGEVK